MITDTQKREHLYFDKKFLDTTLPKTNELLNELAEENEQLRKENDMFSCELSVSANKEISRNCRIAELEEENEQLKQQKEVWKQICCVNSNFNSILLHELDIAREQGFKVSNPFKQFLEDKGDVE